MTPARLPDGVLGMARRGPDWADWVYRLPKLLSDLLEEWQLRMDGWMMHGFVALVVPVRTAGDTPAVLKVSFPEEETEHEHLALQHWAGRGAVRLLRADPKRSAMLLERLHQERLDLVGDLEACEVVAGLYGLVHVAALPQLRPLTTYVARSVDRLAALPRNAPLPRRLVEQAITLAGDFAKDQATTGTMIHGDLHYLNVMAADRAPWLVIDPKPLDGDPHYEPAPMLWNTRTGIWPRSIPACPAGWTWIAMARLAATAVTEATMPGATVCIQDSTACWCCPGIPSTKLGYAPSST